MLSLALASCATRSASPPIAVEKPKPEAVDPRLCADIKPRGALPAGASVPQPVTAEERQGLALFLEWVAELVDRDDQALERARLTQRDVCKPR